MAALAFAATALCDTPSPSDAERYWQKRFENSNGLLRMFSFQKIDGKEAPGVYTLYYMLMFSVTEDCQYDRNYKATKGLPHTEMERLDGMFDKIQGRKGQQLFQSGRMFYEKRESGWVLVSEDISKVSESEATRQSRAAEEEKAKQETLRQQEEVARQEKERQARREPLIAKAKEQHRVIKTAIVKDHPLLGKKMKVILTDSNLTYETKDGTIVLWFGDISDAYTEIRGRDNYFLAILAPGMHPTPCFNSREELEDFYKACSEAYAQWKKDNSALFEK